MTNASYYVIYYEKHHAANREGSFNEIELRHTNCYLLFDLFTTPLRVSGSFKLAACKFRLVYYYKYFIINLIPGLGYNCFTCLELDLFCTVNINRDLGIHLASVGLLFSDCFSNRKQHLKCYWLSTKGYNKLIYQQAHTVFFLYLQKREVHSEVERVLETPAGRKQILDILRRLVGNWKNSIS